jgi:hypothetical protein
VQVVQLVFLVVQALAQVLELALQVVLVLVQVLEQAPELVLVQRLDQVLLQEQQVVLEVLHLQLVLLLKIQLLVASLQHQVHL